MNDPKFPVASEIYNQLGSKALFMMGAYNLAADNDTLYLRIKGSGKVNAIAIKLMADDTYTVTFSKVSGPKFTVSNIVYSVYCDRLHDVIEGETGLYLSV